MLLPSFLLLLMTIEEIFLRCRLLPYIFPPSFRFLRSAPLTLSTPSLPYLSRVYHRSYKLTSGSRGISETTLRWTPTPICWTGSDGRGLLFRSVMRAGFPHTPPHAFFLLAGQ